LLRETVEWKLCISYFYPLRETVPHLLRETVEWKL
jgi:hypothetical protein